MRKLTSASTDTSSTLTRGDILSGDRARRSSGELGLFTVLFLLVLQAPPLAPVVVVALLLDVGDMTVPPDFVANGDGLRTAAEFSEGVLARGETGMQEMERRRGEWPIERASLGNTPAR